MNARSQNHRRKLCIYLSIIASLLMMIGSARAEGSIPVVIKPGGGGTLFIGGQIYAYEKAACGRDTTLDGVGRKCADRFNDFSRGYRWGITCTYTGYTIVGSPTHGGSGIVWTAYLFCTKSTTTTSWTEELTRVSIDSPCPSMSTFDGGVLCNCNPGFVPDSTQTMCINATYTITLSGGDSVEPWHKKFDTDHKKTNLEYTATVKDASGQPSPNVEVMITTEVTQDSGGHVHIDGRPKGKLVETPEGTPTPVSTKDGEDAITGNTNSNGVYSFVFGSEEASGTHTLTAECTGCKAPATTTVKVEVKGLLLLDHDPLSYTLNGETDAHPGSHYFSAEAMTKIINLAFAYSHSPDFNNQLLIINDSSLIKGGVFDLGLDWTYTPNGHKGHRKGVVVDINNYRDGPNPDFELFAQQCCNIDAVWEGPKVTKLPHYHLLLLGRDQ